MMRFEAATRFGVEVWVGRYAGKLMDDETGEGAYEDK
jgi:hypothetical protein